MPVYSYYEGLGLLSVGVLDFFWLEQLFPQKPGKFIMLEGQVFSICKYYSLVGLGEGLIMRKENKPCSGQNGPQRSTARSVPWGTSSVGTHFAGGTL